MSAADLEVFVNSDGDSGVRPEVLREAVLTTLLEEGIRSAEFSLTLLGDDAIQELNRGYLGRDRPTDVIAFSLGEEGAPLGDVYVGVSQARRQADEHGVPFEEELIRLAVHGTLHVLGHDHPEGPDRVKSPMFVRQEALVSRIIAHTPPAPRAGSR